ncbi:MAG: GatB/YqeY domain-containing protein [Patescibacteria group bacterium]
MSLIERLDNDFKGALKAKEAEKLAVLRLVRSNIKNLEISKQAAAGDEDIIAILQREIKQHKETIASLRQAGRSEDVAKQEAEVKFLQAYLPPALSLDELKDVVTKAIDFTGASSITDMGKVMGQVMSQVKGRVTGDEVGQMVRELLGK